MLDEIRNIKSGRKELREFGLTIGAILVILGGLAVWRARPHGPYILGAGIILIALALSFPAALKPFQKAWMALAVVIGFFMSRLVLALLFYGVMAPIGLAAKILGKDLLDERIDKAKVSYWKERPAGETPRESYEKQF